MQSVIIHVLQLMLILDTQACGLFQVVNDQLHAKMSTALLILNVQAHVCCHMPYAVCMQSATRSVLHAYCLQWTTRAQRCIVLVLTLLQRFTGSIEHHRHRCTAAKPQLEQRFNQGCLVPFPWQ